MAYSDWIDNNEPFNDTFESWDSLEKGWQSIFSKIYDFTVDLAQYTQHFWDWLNTPIEIVVRVPFISYTIVTHYTWLNVFGAGFILTLMALYLVKLFVPVA